ncbi:ATP-binding protein [Massilia sp. TS11]|uniref:ATP-binding protein n=1 Tax=Massilia sp. TS11 TaxID=2908003 RepID=UPI001EDC2269|nr:ATP-binding protein [Massilia sp. TS11]MCG2585387.1 ATP-binding protein [Massilia sp. TS11]
MSLRLRLVLMIGSALLLLWLGVALWLRADLARQLDTALDQRLEMAAGMVADLVRSNPDAFALRPGQTPRVLSATESPMACTVESVHGEIVASTEWSLRRQGKPQLGFLTLRDEDGHPWRAYSLRAGNMIVTAGDRAFERERLQRKLLLVAFVPFGVALAVGLLLLWLGVGRGLRPLEKLREALAARAPDAVTPLPPMAMPPDLVPLVRTLDELFERIRDSFARERRFTADAAHELRTPLTAIKLHLQVLRLSQGEDARQALDHAEEGVARLQHTLAQLLILAQVEGAAAADGAPACSAAEVATLAVRDCTGCGGERVRISGDGAALRPLVPQALAVTALRNLLDNALRLAPPDSEVELALVGEGAQIGFVVRDRGPGMEAAELAQATERFWRRGGGHGSGLGLSIVEAIAARFGGRLQLQARAGGGLEAALYLPCAA